MVLADSQDEALTETTANAFRARFAGGFRLLGGNVGIGTTAPKTKLEVTGTISGALLTQNGAGNNYFMGNVGIGTTTPGAKLEVRTTTAGAAISGNQMATTGSNYGGDFEAKGAGATLNVGGYFAAVDGATNYAIQIPASYPGAGANNYSIHSASQAKSYFAGNVGIGTTAPKQKLEVVGTISGSTVLGSNGITTKVNAAACSDGNAQAADGTLCVDSADGGRLYFRYGGVWHYTSQDAGFQIPNVLVPETGRSEVDGIEIGDYVVGRVNERLGDGALHGLWTRFDLATEVGQVVRDHPEFLAGVGSSTSGGINLSDVHDLFVQGTLRVADDALFEGDVAVKGIFSLSPQQMGTVMIPAGATSVTVTYTNPFQSTPTLSITPAEVIETFWGPRATSGTGFTLVIVTPQKSPVTFSWVAIPSSSSPPPQATSDPNVEAFNAFVEKSTGTGSSLPSSGSGSMSPPSEAGAVLIPFPVDSQGIPVSSSGVWNNCIRNTPTLDETGQPLSCSRYHRDFEWDHPDLGITFTWNTHVSPATLLLPEGYAEEVVLETANESNETANTEQYVEPVSGSTDSTPSSESSPGN